MPIIHSMRRLPYVPAVYDIRRDLAERDRRWSSRGNMYLYPNKRDFKGTKMRFRVNELFDEIRPTFIGIPEKIQEFRFNRPSNTAIFALSPEMVQVFCESTLIDTVVYRMLGRTIIVVKKILPSKRMYDGQAFRKFNYKGMRSVRGFAMSKKYNRVMLAGVINTYCRDSNFAGFAKKVSTLIPVPAEDGDGTELVGAAFDPALFRKVDALTASIPILNRFIRTAQLTFMYAMTDKAREREEPRSPQVTRTLVIPRFIGPGNFDRTSMRLLSGPR